MATKKVGYRTSFLKQERIFKDKDKPVEIRASNITAAKGNNSVNGHARWTPSIPLSHLLGQVPHSVAFGSIWMNFPVIFCV